MKSIKKNKPDCIKDVYDSFKSNAKMFSARGYTFHQTKRGGILSCIKTSNIALHQFVQGRKYTQKLVLANEAFWTRKVIEEENGERIKITSRCLGPMGLSNQI